jgi:hypothetical protein
MKGPISLRDYLEKSNLTDHLHLNNSLTFHWTNWDQTCLLQQEYYKQFNNNSHLMTLNSSLLSLQLQPVWLCNKVEVVLTDLYSLYESYLDSRLRLTWHERKNELLFSTSSEHGPYFTLTSMKWFKKEIYAQFVMRKILIEQFTLRSFRLNTAIPILLKFDNDVSVYHDKVSIHQMSEAGLILRISDKNFVNKIKNSSRLECKIPVQSYQNVQGLPFQDCVKKLDNESIFSEKNFKNYQLESRVLNFYGNLINSQRSGDNEFYIFARYEDLIPAGHNVTLAQTFGPIVSMTKSYFAQEIELLERKKLVA